MTDEQIKQDLEGILFRYNTYQITAEQYREEVMSAFARAYVARLMRDIAPTLQEMAEALRKNISLECDAKLTPACALKKTVV